GAMVCPIPGHRGEYAKGRFLCRFSLSRGHIRCSSICRGIRKPQRQLRESLPTYVRNNRRLGSKRSGFLNDRTLALPGWVDGAGGGVAARAPNGWVAHAAARTSDEP